MRLACSVLAILTCLVGERAARADGATAEQVFEEGMRLRESGKIEEACATFAKSLAKDPRQLGALMNLGRCHYELGEVASALRYYREARARAEEQNKTKTLEAAKAQEAQLAGEVARLVFLRRGAVPPGERLVVDEQVVTSVTELEVDPGRHVIVVTAPGRIPRETVVTIAPREQRQVEVPVLEVPRNTVETRERSSRRTAGQIMTFAGIGLAVAATGVVIGAKRDYDALFEGDLPHCGLHPAIDGRPACDAYGVDRAARDRRLIDAGAIGGGVALAVIAAGVYLWTTAPAEVRTTRVVPVVSPTTVGVTLEGALSW